MLPMVSSVGRLSYDNVSYQNVGKVGPEQMRAVGEAVGTTKDVLVTDHKVNCRIPRLKLMNFSHPYLDSQLQDLEESPASRYCAIFSVRTIPIQNPKPLQECVTNSTNYYDSKALNKLLALHWDIATKQLRDYLDVRDASIVNDFVKGGAGDGAKFLNFIIKQGYMAEWLKYRKCGLYRYTTSEKLSGPGGLDLRKAMALNEIVTMSIVMSTVEGVLECVRPHGVLFKDFFPPSACISNRFQELDMHIHANNKLVVPLVSSADFMDEICPYYGQLTGNSVFVMFGRVPSSAIERSVGMRVKSRILVGPDNDYERLSRAWGTSWEETKVVLLEIQTHYKDVKNAKDFKNAVSDALGSKRVTRYLFLQLYESIRQKFIKKDSLDAQCDVVLHRGKTLLRVLDPGRSFCSWSECMEMSGLIPLLEHGKDRKDFFPFNNYRTIEIKKTDAKIQKSPRASAIVCF